MTKEYKTIKLFDCANGFVLKLIAIITMLIDHVGAVLYPNDMLFRYIGRIAFPIFVFLLVEGAVHTRNIRKYELRMLIFALASEVCFDLAFFNTWFYFSYQNVFFTLLLGVIMLDFIQHANNKIWLEIAIVILFMIIANFLNTDYSAGGVLLVYVFYRFRNRHLVKYILMAPLLYFFYGAVECYALFAIVVLLMYNGERGFRGSKALYGGGAGGKAAVCLQYGFYLFYPVHLFILHLLQMQKFFLPFVS